VVAGDEDDRGARQGLPQALELMKGEDNRGVAGAYRMEEIAGDGHSVGPRRDHTVDRRAKRLRDIRLTLIDPGRRLPVVLPNAQMGVGDVRQFHPRNVS
jgi:hypothetical protein